MKGEFYAVSWWFISSGLAIMCFVPLIGSFTYHYSTLSSDMINDDISNSVVCGSGERHRNFAHRAGYVCLPVL